MKNKSYITDAEHEMNLDGFDYIDIFKMLSDEKKNELKTQKKYFKKIAGF